MMKSISWILNIKPFYYILGVLVIALFLIGLFRTFFLTCYANWFITDNASKGADAIIILSGGRMTRTPKGLDLWQKGFAPLIFLTNEQPRNSNYQHLEISNLEFAKRVAAQSNANVPWAVIPSISGGGTSTFDEAVDTLRLAKERDWRRIIIVTDHFHTRRALYAFEKVFDKSGIEVQVGAANNEIFDATNWWTSDIGISSFVLETIKYPIYLFWSEEPKLVRND